jgi:hypothetical protein
VNVLPEPDLILSIENALQDDDVPSDTFSIDPNDMLTVDRMELGVINEHDNEDDVDMAGSTDNTFLDDDLASDSHESSPGADRIAERSPGDSFTQQMMTSEPSEIFGMADMDNGSIANYSDMASYKQNEQSMTSGPSETFDAGIDDDILSQQFNPTMFVDHDEDETISDFVDDISETDSKTELPPAIVSTDEQKPPIEQTTQGQAIEEQHRTSSIPSRLSIDVSDDALDNSAEYDSPQSSHMIHTESSSSTWSSQSTKSESMDKALFDALSEEARKPVEAPNSKSRYPIPKSNPESIYRTRPEPLISRLESTPKSPRDTEKDDLRPSSNWVV